MYDDDSLLIAMGLACHSSCCGSLGKTNSVLNIIIKSLLFILSICKLNYDIRPMPPAIV